MKNRLTLNSILVMLGLIAAVLGAYTFGRFFLNPGLSEPVPVFSTAYSDSVPLPFPASEPKTAATLPGRIHSFAISPDLKTIAIATSQGTVLYDLESNEEFRILNGKENSFSVAWSRDGKMLAVGNLVMGNSEAGEPHLVVWDTSTWKTRFEPQLGNGDTTFFFGALAWSPYGNFLATSDYGRGLDVFDVNTGRIISAQKDFLVSPYDISWSPNGTRLIATGDLGFGFRRWRIDTGEAVRLYDNRVGTLATQLAWSPSGERIASTHGNGFVCFWTVATNRCDGLIKAHRLSAFSLAWSPDETQLATGGGIIRIWDTSTGNLVTSLGLNNTSIYSQLKWLADGTLVSLETGYADHELTKVRFWDIKAGKITREFQGASGVFGE